MGNSRHTEQLTNRGRTTAHQLRRAHQQGRRATWANKPLHHQGRRATGANKTLHHQGRRATGANKTLYHQGRTKQLTSRGEQNSSPGGANKTAHRIRQTEHCSLARVKKKSLRTEQCQLCALFISQGFLGCDCAHHQLARPLKPL